MQLSGELSKVSLSNLLQLVRNGEMTGKIALLQGAKTATIYVERGEVIHAEQDMMRGREALLELFLWSTGTFSFFEEEMSQAPRSLSPLQRQEDTLEKIIREGAAYVEQRKYFDQNQISGQTVLALTDVGRDPAARQKSGLEPVLALIDGRINLSEALAESGLGRRTFLQSIYRALVGGLVCVAAELPAQSGDHIVLPPWVVARLKQDNPDISQSIVDMVIWVDRVKCWMYQVDSDFTRILQQMTVAPQQSEDDFFEQLEEGTADYQGPLFGEAAIPSDSPQPPGGTTGAPGQGGMQQSTSGSQYYATTTGAPPPDQEMRAPDVKPQPPSGKKQIEF